MKKRMLPLILCLVPLSACNDGDESYKDWSEERCNAARYAATSSDSDADTAQDAAVDYSLHC